MAISTSVSAPYPDFRAGIQARYLEPAVSGAITRMPSSL
jgi:hypothetical protein